MNSARAWPPFSGPPQHFSNEHSLIEYKNKECNGNRRVVVYDSSQLDGL